MRGESTNRSVSMSCWVVAALAAEVLGIPVNQVLERIRNGSLPAKTDLGFLLVDVAPNAPKMEVGTRAPGRRPATYKPIAEVRATEEASIPKLTRSPRGGRLNLTPATREEAETQLTLEEELALSVDPDPSPGPSRFDAIDWRQSRAAASRTRVRPASARA